MPPISVGGRASCAHVEAAAVHVDGEPSSSSERKKGGGAKLREERPRTCAWRDGRLGCAGSCVLERRALFCRASEQREMWMPLSPCLALSPLYACE
jgi:hypothetical protein